MKTSIDSTSESSTLTIMPFIVNEKHDTLISDSIAASSCMISESDSKDHTTWLKDGQPSGWTQLLLPVFITLLVVFLEKLIDRSISNTKKRLNRRSYRKTIIDWIRLIAPIENHLSKSLSDLSDLVANSDDMQPERYAMPTTIPDKLGSLTVEQMMDAFLTDFKGDEKKGSIHIYNIISCLDFLSKTRNEIMKAYEAYNKQSISCCEQWNTEVSEFKKWIIQHNEDEIKNIVRLWAASLIVKKDSIRAHEKLVNDLLQLHDTDLEIAPTLTNMKNIILQRKVLSNGYSTIFTDLSKNITLSLEQLSEACAFFEDNKSY